MQATQGKLVQITHAAKDPVNSNRLSTSPSGLNLHRATQILARVRNKHARFTHAAIGTPLTRAQHTVHAPGTATPAPGTELEINATLPRMTKPPASASFCRGFSKLPKTIRAP
eukprot:7320366-Alexandrium_andersonii.AAC.1